MHNKMYLAILVALYSIACVATETNTTKSASTKPVDRPNITTLSGVTYKRCKITRVEPDGISVFHSTGIAKIPFSSLPTKLQTKYGYDPMQSAAYSKQQSEKRRRAYTKKMRELSVQRQNQKRDLELEQLVKNIRKHRSHLSGEIIQILKKGVLLYPKQKITADLEPIFLLGIGDGLHDGSKWSGYAYPAGRYKYVSVNGSGKTIKRYAVSATLAAKTQFEDQ